MELGKLALYALMTAQIIAWVWFQSKGGSLNYRGFMLFTFCMLLGQTGAAIESFGSSAWGTFGIQIVFFFSTVFGGITRFHQTRKPATIQVAN